MKGSLSPHIIAPLILNSSSTTWEEPPPYMRHSSSNQGVLVAADLILDYNCKDRAGILRRCPSYWDDLSYRIHWLVDAIRSILVMFAGQMGVGVRRCKSVHLCTAMPDCPLQAIVGGAAAIPLHLGGPKLLLYHLPC
jgi:hypothetical protein